MTSSDGWDRDVYRLDTGGCSLLPEVSGKKKTKLRGWIVRISGLRPTTEVNKWNTCWSSNRIGSLFGWTVERRLDGRLHPLARGETPVGLGLEFYALVITLSASLILRRTHISLESRSAALLDTLDFLSDIDDVFSMALTVARRRCCRSSVVTEPTSAASHGHCVAAWEASSGTWSCSAVASVLRVPNSTLESDSMWTISFCDDSCWKSKPKQQRYIKNTHHTRCDVSASSRLAVSPRHRCWHLANVSQ